MSKYDDVAQDHIQTKKRYECIADNFRNERAKLEAELNGLTAFKKLSPRGLILSAKISELKKEEKRIREMAQEYKNLAFKKNIESWEKQAKEKQKPQRDRSHTQVDRDITAEAKRLSQTTFGKIVTCNEKLQETTNPQEREKLEKDLAGYREQWEKESGGKMEAYEVSKPEPKSLNLNDIVVRWEKPENISQAEVEERKQKLLDLHDEINEPKPGNPKQLSLTPHMPPPNIQPEPEKTTPEKAIEPKSVNEIEKDMMGSKQEARQNLDKLSLKEIQVIGRGCFANLRDNGYQCKIETDPAKKAELEKERDSLNENWQGIKQGVFDAAEREHGQDRIRDRETDRDPDRR